MNQWMKRLLLVVNNGFVSSNFRPVAAAVVDPPSLVELLVVENLQETNELHPFLEVAVVVVGGS